MRRLRYRKGERGRNAVRHERNSERVRLTVKRGDTVRVMRGEEKGSEGKIIRVYPKTGRVTVEGVNIVKRHRKARRAEEESQIMEMPAPIHHSNVMLLDPRSGAPTRVRRQVGEDGSKERIAVKSGDAISGKR